MESMTKVILFQGGLLAVQGISYLLVQHTKHIVHDMARPIDQKIPLVPQFIFVYIMWYPLLAIFPLALYKLDTGIYHQYIISIFVDILISLLIYWFYPTSFTRPKPASKGLSGRLLQTMYVIDYKGLNCMPSMHCSMCFIIMYYTFVCGEMAHGIQTLFAGLAALIVMSTVFTKQHVLIDVITAMPLACICIVMGGMFSF